MKPKRLISLLVAVCMMVTMLPVSALTAFAAVPIEIDGIQYQVDDSDNNASVVGYVAEKLPQNGKIEIKSHVGENNKYTVTAIKASAFERCTSLKGELILPDTVTVIGEKAFYGCTGLTGNLSIPDGVVQIGNYAFDGCKGLTGNLTIADSVTSIGDFAFNSCDSLSGVLTMSQNVQSIGQYAFNSCSKLTGDFAKIIPSSVTSISIYAFNGCSNLSGVLTVPGTVQSISNYAFHGCSKIEIIVLSDGVQTVGNYAFESCSNVKNIEMADSVTAIGNNAFNGCKALNTLKISNNIQTIGQFAFYGSSLLTGNFTVPSSVTKIGRSAFGLSGLDSFTLPNDLQNLTLEDSALSSKQTAKIFITNCDNRDAVANVVANIEAIAGLDKENLKIGSNYICYYCDVTFDTDGGMPTSEAQTSILRTNKLDTSKIHTPSKEGYVFDGWYYEKDGQQLKFDPARSTVLDSMTLTAKWKQHATAVISGFDGTPIQQGEPKEFTVTVDPHDDTGNAVLDFGKDNANIEYWDGSDWTPIPANGLSINLNDGKKDYQFRLVCVSDGSSQTLRVSIRVPSSELGGDDVSFDTVNENKLTVTGGTVKVDGVPVELDADSSCVVKKDSLVEVTFDRSSLADTQTFDQWMTDSSRVLGVIDPNAETIKFTMPAEAVTLTALTTIDDCSSAISDVVSTVVVIGTVAVGGAVAYQLGTELWLNCHLPEWAAIPNTRAELAKLLWQDAGQPAAASDMLYCDISADDTDAQTAARWAVENGLLTLPDENDNTRFDPDARVSRITVIKAWKKAQTLK